MTINGMQFGLHPGFRRRCLNNSCPLFLISMSCDIEIFFFTERAFVVKFIYNGQLYESDWTKGYVQLPHGVYLSADFVEGQPTNICQKKLIVAPVEFATAKPINEE